MNDRVYQGGTQVYQGGTRSTNEIPRSNVEVPGLRMMHRIYLCRTAVFFCQYRFTGTLATVFTLIGPKGLFHEGLTTFEAPSPLDTSFPEGGPLSLHHSYLWVYHSSKSLHHKSIRPAVKKRTVSVGADSPTDPSMSIYFADILMEVASNTHSVCVTAPRNELPSSQ